MISLLKLDYYWKARLINDKLYKRWIKVKAMRAERYAGWDATADLSSLDACFDHVTSNDISPKPKSGKQERLENYVSRFV